MSRSLRLIFMGTPDFSVPTLQRLIDGPHQVIAVYSQPPRPKGRGQKVQKSPVHALAEHHHIPVFTPNSLRSDEEQRRFLALEADLAIVIAYGLILPLPILDAPVWGCVNIHASLLPRWRGAAPIQRSILAGDKETGVTIMKMDEGLDTGPILAMRKIKITEETTTYSLLEWMGENGAGLLIDTLLGYVDHHIRPYAQPHEGVTYASKLLKEEGKIDWLRCATDIDYQVRALNPWPGVYFVHNGVSIKILASQVIETSDYTPPGTILPNLTIACGRNALKINVLQKPGSKAMTADEFCRGYEMLTGTCLICPAIV